MSKTKTQEVAKTQGVKATPETKAPKAESKYVQAVKMFVAGKEYKEIAKALSTTENYVSGNVNDAETGLKSNSPQAYMFADDIKKERERRTKLREQAKAKVEAAKPKAEAKKPELVKA